MFTVAVEERRNGYE